MARPIEWLPRVPEIRRSVQNSLRSHYTRAELEELFLIQQATASRLLDLLPTVKMNTGHLVEKDELLKFLNRVDESDDVSGLLKALREEKRAPSRRKVRSFVRRHLPPAMLAGMPDSLKIERGGLSITFETIDELVTTLFILAQMLNDDMEEFSRRYEPAKPPEIDEAAKDVAELFRDLEEREAHRLKENGTSSTLMP